MSRNIFMGPPVYAYKPYGCLSFLWDTFMTIMTCGLWLIWIFFRARRDRNRVYRYYSF
jgi:hypothetical protein